jgi:enterochelin esterase-like enzyme
LKPLESLYFVGATGFEPATSCSQSKRASRTAPRPDINLTEIVSRDYHAPVPSPTLHHAPIELMSIMRGMSTRQATKWAIIFFTLLMSISSCSRSDQLPPISSKIPSVSTPVQAPTSIPIPAIETLTSTPIACLSQPGRVESGKLASTKPAQEYIIYLPPCYDEQTTMQYPVLYLLHGQTYTADQWIRLGAVDAMDQLIRSGESQPFIIVFPDDRYWNLEAGPGFGDRLVNALIPYIDETYRTIPDRKQRAIGGLSRGSGWALRLGLTRWDLFNIIGLHSLAVFQRDGSRIEKWLAEIPLSSHPTIFMDIGDNDPELARALSVESIFTENGIVHEWHLYSGAHTEEYWRAHVAEYIGWYANQWHNP